MSEHSLSVDMDSDTDCEWNPSLNESGQPLDYEDDEGYEGGEGDEVECEPEPREEETGIGSNLVVKKKRGGNKRQPSIVWAHLTKFEKKLEDGTFYPYAKCNACGRELLAHPQRNGTSGLIGHLQRCVDSPLFKESPGTQTTRVLDVQRGVEEASKRPGLIKIR